MNVNGIFKEGSSLFFLFFIIIVGLKGYLIQVVLLKLFKEFNIKDENSLIVFLIAKIIVRSMHVLQNIQSCGPQGLIYIIVHFLQVVTFCFQEGNKLKQILFYHICVCFEAFLLLRLISDILDKLKNSLYHRRFERVFISKLNAQIQKYELINVLFVFNTKIEREFH